MTNFKCIYHLSSALSGSGRGAGTVAEGHCNRGRQCQWHWQAVAAASLRLTQRPRCSGTGRCTEPQPERRKGPFLAQMTRTSTLPLLPSPNLASPPSICASMRFNLLHGRGLESAPACASSPLPSPPRTQECVQCEHGRTQECVQFDDVEGLACGFQNGVKLVRDDTARGQKGHDSPTEPRHVLLVHQSRIARH